MTAPDVARASILMLLMSCSATPAPECEGESLNAVDSDSSLGGEYDIFASIRISGVAIDCTVPGFVTYEAYSEEADPFRASELVLNILPTPADGGVAEEHKMWRRLDGQTEDAVFREYTWQTPLREAGIGNGTADPNVTTFLCAEELSRQRLNLVYRLYEEPNELVDCHVFGPNAEQLGQGHYEDVIPTDPEEAASCASGGGEPLDFIKW